MRLALSIAVAVAVLLSSGTAFGVTVKKIGVDTLTHLADSLVGWQGDNTSHFGLTIEDNLRMYYNRSDADSLKMTRVHWTNGYFDTIWVFLDWSNAGAVDYTVKCAVYDTTTAGVDATLLQSTEERTISSSSSDGWYGFELDPPLSVVGGRSYCFGAWANASTQTVSVQRLSSAPTSSHQQGASTYGSWPNPLNLASTLSYYVAICANWTQSIPSTTTKKKKTTLLNQWGKP